MATAAMLRRRTLKTFTLTRAVGVLAALLALAPMARSQFAKAVSPSDDVTPAQAAALKCLGGTTGTLTASVLLVFYKETNPETVTLTWAATIPSTCSGITLSIGSTALARAGTMTVQPLATTRYTLRARSAVGSKEVA